MKKRLSLLMALVCLFKIGFTTNDGSFWNTTMQSIADPKSKPGWITFKSGSNIQPGTLFTDYKAAFNLGTDDEMVKYQTQTDKMGYIHNRYQLYYKGVKVEGSTCIEHSKDGIVKTASGRIKNVGSINITPSLSNSQALTFALNEVNAELYMWEDPQEEQSLRELSNNTSSTYYPAPELIISESSEDENLILMFRVVVFSKNPFDQRVTYVDALTGGILNNYTLIKSCEQGKACTKYNGTKDINTKAISGGFKLIDECRGNGIVTNYYTNASPDIAVDAIDNDNFWPSMGCSVKDVGASAHWASEMVYDYFLNKQGWNSYDNLGGPMQSIVDDASGGAADNAWCIPGITANVPPYVLIGKPQSSYFDFPVSLDALGHEWTHAVNFTGPNLDGKKVIGNGSTCEPAALNESFSDIFGTAIEFFGQGGTGNWLNGDEFTNQTQRDLSNPKANSHPDTYRGINWISTATCLSTLGGSWANAHRHNGVQNHWFYLLVNGGSGINDYVMHGNVMGQYSYSLTGLGMEKASAITFLNFTTQLNSESKFQDARQGSIEAAVELFGCNSDEVNQVIEAWNAVGVYDMGLPIEPAGVDITCHGKLGICDGWNKAFTYQWYPTEGLDNPNIPNPIATPITTTTYTVLVTNTMAYDYYGSNLYTEDYVVVTIPNTVKNYTTASSGTWKPSQNPFNVSSGVIIVENTLRIQAPAKITIQDMTFKFGPNGKIIIEPGAKLTTVRSTFNANNQCVDGNTWAGIEIIGNSGEAQTSTKQGSLRITDNSWIIAARIGILAGGAVSEKKGGGMIWVENSNIYNNVIGVSIKNYSKKSNCSFVKSNFTTNPSIDYSVGISMNEVSGVAIRGCTFNGVGATKNYLGKGIASNNASYKVLPHCDIILQPGQSCPDANTFINTFFNLDYGIKANNTVLNPIVVHRTIFDKNYNGILMEGCNNASVTYNDFDIKAVNYNTPAYGLYLGGSTAYKVEFNKFTADNFNARTFGVYIRNSGKEANMVNNNSFSNLFMASGANGYNSSNEVDKGLKFHCNDYDGDNYEIAVSQGDVAPIQGVAGTDPKTLAGNRFFQAFCFGDNNQFHFNNRIIYDANGNPYSGFFQTQYQTQAGYDPHLKCFDQTNIYYLQSTLAWDASHCPSIKKKKSLQSEIKKEKQMIKENNDLIEKGNDPALASALKNKNGIYHQTLHQTLIERSPYLSDEIIKLILEKQNISTEKRMQVLRLNKPFTEEIKQVIRPETYTKLTPVEKEELLVGSYQESARAKKINEISYSESMISLYADEAITRYLTDTLNDHPNDSIRRFIQEYNINGKDPVLMDLEIKEGKFQKAEQINNKMFSETGNARLKELNEKKIALAKQQHEAVEPKLNPSDSVLIRIFAEDTGKIDFYDARKLYNLVFEKGFKEVLIYPETDGDRSVEEPMDPVDHETTSMNSNNLITPKEKLSFSIYPNPSNGTFNVQTRGEINGELRMEISDLLGRQIRKTNLAPGLTSIIGMEQGIYLIRIHDGGSTLELRKIIIN